MEGTQVIPVTPRTARRKFNKDFKRELVQQAMLPGVSRAALALANGINANQLARWCREHQRADQVTFVPVVSPASTPSAYVHTQRSSHPSSEMVWQHGDTSIVFRGHVDADIVRMIISQTLASSRTT